MYFLVWSGFATRLLFLMAAGNPLFLFFSFLFFSFLFFFFFFFFFLFLHMYGYARHSAITHHVRRATEEFSRSPSPALLADMSTFIEVHELLEFGTSCFVLLHHRNL